MDELRTLIFGIAGGVIGAFFKFWIEDLRNWADKRLKRREKLLLRLMKLEDGMALFVIRKGCPPFFTSRYQDIDHPEQDFRFDDLGEVERLEKFGIIERVPNVSHDERLYRLSGKAYK